MVAIAKVGDTSSHGGNIVSGGSTTVTWDGAQPALDQAILACPSHGNQPITATGKLQIDGKKAVRVGDYAACGAQIQGGIGSSSDPGA